MPQQTPDWMPNPRERAAMAKRLAGAASAMTTAALTEITRRHPWFTDLDADNRASVTLVVRAGVDGFAEWFRAGARDVEQPNIFAAAPRSLMRRMALQQTVDLIRTTVETVEQQIQTELPRSDRAALNLAVLHFSREIAFDAAEVYARAAETRGAWDARLEALVMDAVVRGDADESVVSRASTLGWHSPDALCVVIGDLPTDASLRELRSHAARAGLDVLASAQGPRLVVLIGGSFRHEEEALEQVAKLVGSFGEGPVVMGPVVDDLVEAVVSARAATSGRRAVSAWPDAPRPVSARALLPERALAGDGHARRELAHDVYGPLAAHSADLVETLEAYWAAGTSIEATARRLFIHANTVRYRLARIEDITGYAPADPREGYVLRLAGTLGRLLD